MELKFIVDYMLGRLCKWLRVIGYDTVYYRENDKDKIVYQSLKEQRIIVTRNQSLSKRKAWKIILLKDNSLSNQIRQFVTELNLVIDQKKIFSRCIICNTVLEKIDKEKVETKVPVYVYQTINEFSFCPQCDKIYWKGSHWELMNKQLAELNF